VRAHLPHALDPNPDSDNIKKAEWVNGELVCTEIDADNGNEAMCVYPTGNPAQDAANIQWAVGIMYPQHLMTNPAYAAWFAVCDPETGSNPADPICLTPEPPYIPDPAYSTIWSGVASGGTVLLKAHKYNEPTNYTAFNLDGYSVNIQNDVTIRGEKLSSTWGNDWSETTSGNTNFTTPSGSIVSDRAVIYGGGKTEILFGFLPYPTGAMYMEQQKNLTVEGLRFDHSVYSNISIYSSAEVAIHDNVVTNSQLGFWFFGLLNWCFAFTELYNPFLGFPPVAGPISIEHNLIDQIGDDGTASNELLSGIHCFNVSVEHANVDHNTVRNCPSFGMFLDGICETPDSELWVRYNDISQRDYGITPGPARWALVCAGPYNAHVIDNTMSVSQGPPTPAPTTEEEGGLYSNAIDFTGVKNSEIRGNNIHMEKRAVEDRPDFVAQAIAIDGSGSIALEDQNVIVDDNTITGNPLYPPDWVIAVGHVYSREEDHTNIQIINNDFSGITAGVAQVLFGPKVYESLVQGNEFGPLAEGGEAGILCLGDSNTIYNNEFGNSGIIGIKNGGSQVCVKLAAEEDNFGAILNLPANNFVKEQGNYPVGTGGAKFQILDAWAELFEHGDIPPYPQPGDELPNRIVGHDQGTIAEQYAENPGIGQFVRQLRPHVTPVQSYVKFGPKPEGWPEGEPWPPGQ
jgi:hypothetical protein